MKKIIATCFALSIFCNVSPTYAAFPNDLEEGVVLLEEALTPGLTDFINTFEETTTLTVTFPGESINLAYDRRNIWPNARGRNGSTDLRCCVANTWAFIEVDGIWYGATWEFLRNGQTIKSQTALRGPRHLRFPPLENFNAFGSEGRGGTIPNGRVPNGTVIGFMVAGITRNSLGFNNVRERSDIVFYKVGTGQITAEEAGFEPEVTTTAAGSNTAGLVPVIDLLMNETTLPAASAISAETTQ